MNAEIQEEGMSLFRFVRDIFGMSAAFLIGGFALIVIVTSVVAICL